MNNFIIPIIVSTVYSIGFFTTYIQFSPKNDTWKGWIIDLLLSMIWPITIPFYCLRKKKKEGKK